MFILQMDFPFYILTFVISTQIYLSTGEGL